jgi:fatty-acid peroxygenase
VRQEFEWRGLRFPEGRRVLLDVYGTNRDDRTWDRPDTFRPERFAGRQVDPFTLIPQGGGDHASGHRCAGEWATVELLQGAIRALRGLRYAVPAQDLRIRLNRIPAQPESGFRIELP